MNIYQERQPVRAFFASRPVLVGLFLLLIGMGVVSFRSLLAGKEVEQERQEVEQELQGLEAKKEELTSELEDLRSGNGIEREARQKLNFRKPGEELVIILDDENNKNEGKKAETFSFFERLKKIFNYQFSIFNQ